MNISRLLTIMDYTDRRSRFGLLSGLFLEINGLCLTDAYLTYHYLKARFYNVDSIIVVIFPYFAGYLLI
jgi:hypothetical protein